MLLLNAQKIIIFMILNKGQRNTRHTSVIDVDIRSQSILKWKERYVRIK